ncbi:MAG: serine--tRNA ligase, partial [Synergistaceae bacterium]|nr:serine--tRNA ligase [Synergistaceae bacterium]
MLDIKYILANKEEYAEMLRNRKHDFDLNRLVELDERRRSIIGRTEDLKAKRNEGSRKIGSAKNNPGLDVDSLKAEIKAMGEEIKALDSELAEVESELHTHLMTLPNTLSPTTPIGNDENDNPVVRTWGEPRKFDFEPKAHWDIAEPLGIMDFERGVMLAQSRFTV